MQNKITLIKTDANIGINTTVQRSDSPCLLYKGNGSPLHVKIDTAVTLVK